MSSIAEVCRVLAGLVGVFRSSGLLLLTLTEGSSELVTGDKLGACSRGSGLLSRRSPSAVEQMEVGLSKIGGAVGLGLKLV